ncbi:MFS transporter [Streptomyces sp. NPDC020875]|uniref:MFS transporter n=1 Tax=Streptomyces sp. NPDC020875 TaxID=3154898 RepID=UPI0033D3CB84
MTAATATAAAARRPAPGWTFALVSAGGVVMTLDVTVVNVALTEIARDLDTGLGQVQWTVSGYSLAFGALLLTAGALSDRIGRRAVFTAGTALFTLASAACGLAPGAASLIAARAAQGVGGALMFAPALALLAAAYRDEERRRSAIAAFAAIASGAGALGPVVGGVAVEAAGWRWIFLVNVPIGVLVIAGALTRMPESKAATGPSEGAGAGASGAAGRVGTGGDAGSATAPEPGAAAPAPPAPTGHRRIDPLGALLAVGALLALHYPLVAGPEHGWTSARVLVPAALGVPLAVALVLSQRRGDGLLDLSLLRIPAFAGAAVLGFLARLTGLGTLALTTLWLAGTHSYSPLETGLHLLPLTGSLLITGIFVARLQRAFPASTLVATGFALMGAGLLALAGAGAGAPGAVTVTGFVLLGAGSALVFPPLMGIAVAAVPPDRAGMASGLTNAAYPLGTAAGVAVFGAVFASVLTARLGTSDGLRAAVETARFDLVPGASRAAAESAFSSAFTLVCLLAAAICAAGALLAARTLRTRAPAPAEETAGEAAEPVREKTAL